MSGEKAKETTEEKMSDVEEEGDHEASSSQTMETETKEKMAEKALRDVKEDKDNSKSADVCRDYLRNVCKRKKHCKFSHPVGLKGSEGKWTCGVRAIVMIYKAHLPSSL